MNWIFFFTLLFSINLFAEEEEEILFPVEDTNIFFRDKNFKNENVKKSHFFMNLETTLLMYKNEISYSGQQAKLEPTDSLALIGPSVGIGIRFKMFGNFSTSSHVSFYQLVKRQHDIDRASEEIPVIISEQENDNRITGLEFSQRFFLQFEITEKSYFEPFVQVGLGYAQSESTYEHYFYDYIDSEYFSATVTEQLLTQNVAIGFNIMNQNGLFFIFKVQKNVLTIGEQETEISQFAYVQNGLGTPTNTSFKIDVDENRDEYSVTLGAGYVF